MKNNDWTRDDICHWCGITYKRPTSDRKHRFHSKTCKQAHYRAYKKYVTRKRYLKAGAQGGRVTRKKPKKRKCDTCTANPEGCALSRNSKVEGCKRYVDKRKKKGETHVKKNKEKSHKKV